jgi:hypothetical protein
MCALMIPHLKFTPDSSVYDLLNLPSLISPEKVTFWHLEGSNPSATRTLLQSSQLQPLDVSFLISVMVGFLNFLSDFISERLI